MAGSSLTLTTICAPSDDVVAGEVEGEMVIVPLGAGIADAESELCALNPTGQAVWQKLDGQHTLQEVVAALAGEFDVPLPDLERDVLGFVRELTRRGFLTVKAKG